MTFFGNVLVEKNIISKAKLVDALVQQSEALHSPAQIAFEEQLLQAEQILEAINNKDPGETFATVCKRLGFWDEEIQAKVSDMQKKDRKPLGQILVEDFGVDLSTVSSELAESKPESTPAPQSEMNNDNVNIDSEFKFTFPQVSGETKKQYLDFFSSDIKNSLESQIQQLTGGDGDPAIITSLEETVQQITAAASFARMEISFAVGDKLSQLIEKIAGKSMESFQDKEDVKKVCLSTLDVLWELHRFIDVSGSEDEFWENEISRSNFSTVINNLNRLISL